MATRLPKRFEDRHAAIKAERVQRREAEERGDHVTWFKNELWYWRQLEALYVEIQSHVSGLLWEVAYDAEQRAKGQIQGAVQWLNEFGAELAK